MSDVIVSLENNTQHLSWDTVNMKMNFTAYNKNENKSAPGVIDMIGAIKTFVTNNATGEYCSVHEQMILSEFSFIIENATMQLNGSRLEDYII